MIRADRLDRGNEIYLHNTRGDSYYGRLVADEADPAYYVGAVLFPDTIMGGVSLSPASPPIPPTRPPARCFVDSYYDFESLQTFTPVRPGTPAGTAYLESESDAILAGGNAAYSFDSGERGRRPGRGL